LVIFKKISPQLTQDYTEVFLPQHSMLVAMTCEKKVSLVPRLHPAHTRRRGLVSRVQICGLAPET